MRVVEEMILICRFGLVLLMLPMFANGQAPTGRPETVADAIAKNVEGRDLAIGYVHDIVEKFKPQDSQYVQARKLYRTALSKYCPINVAPNRNVEWWAGRDIDQRTEGNIPFCIDRSTQAHAMTYIR